MTKFILLRGAALFLAAVSPVLVCAQFQQPTDEELKMTADPKAPGAAAVYLYREETTDDKVHLRSFYARIKVLTEKGEELATIQIPFEHGYTKVEKVEGRTIHTDGTVIPLAVKPEDLVDFKSKYFQENRLVFTLPEVEVGSILEYRFQLRYSNGRLHPPVWRIQQSYFVHMAHYLFRPDWNSVPYLPNDHGPWLKSLIWAVEPASDTVKVKREKNDYTLDVTDIPPIPDEDWMPPANMVIQHVVFGYASTADGFWSNERVFWAVTTEGFIQESGTIKKAAAGLVSPGDTDEQKARKIYAAVTKLDNTDWSRVKSKAERKKEKLKDINTVDDVWKNQSGPGNSIPLIYVALARAAGLKAWPMQVVDRNRALFDYSYLDAGQLDDYIAIVNVGGKDIAVDPAQKVAPFGSLHWAHTLAKGFRGSDSGPVLSQTPASSYEENTVTRTADLTLDADGNVTGTARIVLSGAEALYWRQQALQNDVEEVKKQFKEDLAGDLPDGIEVDFDHFVQLEDPESNLMAVVNLKGKFSTATGKRFFLPGLFFETRAKHPFVSQDKRTAPVDVHFPEMESDDVVYHLPPGYTVESAPRTPEVNWTGIAQMRINSAVKEDSVEVTRVFARTFTLLKPEDYGDLHNFYLRLALADQQQILLSRPVAAKGN